MPARGLQDVPLNRIPAKWDPAWFAKFCREVLSLADVRNALSGTGVTITGGPSEPATISASTDVANLLLQSYVLATPSGFLSNERILGGESGVVTITDGGPNGNIDVGLQEGGVPYSKLIDAPAFSVLGNQLTSAGPIAPITGVSEGDVLWIRDIDGAGTLGLEFSYLRFLDGSASAPGIAFYDDQGNGIYRIGTDNFGLATDGTLRWDINTTRVLQNIPLIVQNNSGVLVSNAFAPGAGVEITTSGADPLGVNGQVAFWEQPTKEYGFRFFMDGSPASEAYLDLYRHDNNVAGSSILRFTRTTGTLDLFTKLQLADGALATPTLTFTSDTDLGFFRRGANDLGVAAVNSRFVSDGGALETSVEIQATASNRFATLGLVNSSGTRVLNLGYGNSSASLSNLAFLNMPTGIDFLFRTSGTERWRLLGAGNLRAVDSVELQLGAGPDLRLSHDGTNSIVRNDTGDLIFQASTTEKFRMTAAGASLSLSALANQLAVLVTANSTTGQSFGQRINAGTNTSDYALRIANQAGSTDYLRVRGDGRTHFHDGTAALPSMSFLNDTDTGFYSQAGNAIGVSANGAEVARFDASATAGNTRLLIYDVDNGALERVTVGAADSGGTGFKVLRIPN